MCLFIGLLVGVVVGSLIGSWIYERFEQQIEIFALRLRGYKRHVEPGPGGMWYGWRYERPGYQSTWWEKDNPRE